MWSLPPAPGAHHVLDGRVGAVELRAVPPVRRRVQERRREGRAGRPGRVGQRLQHLERRRRPGIAGLEGQLERVLGVAAAVAEPVADHELDPRGGEQVQRLGGDERLAGEQLAADGARVRLHQQVVRLALGRGERDVAAEARAGHAHARLGEVVVDALVGARGQEPGRKRRHRRRVHARLAARVVQVLLAQDVAQAFQHGEAERRGQLVPADAAVGRGRGVVVQAPAERVAIAGSRDGIRPVGGRKPLPHRLADDHAEAHGDAGAHEPRQAHRRGLRLAQPGPGGERERGVERRDRGRDHGRSGRDLAGQARERRRCGVARVDHRGDAHGRRAHLAVGQQELEADQDGAHPEHAKDVLDRLVVRPADAEIAREHGGRDQRRGSVCDPNHRQCDSCETGSATGAHLRPPCPCPRA